MARALFFSMDFCSCSLRDRMIRMDLACCRQYCRLPSGARACVHSPGQDRPFCRPSTVHIPQLGHALSVQQQQQSQQCRTKHRLAAAAAEARPDIGSVGEPTLQAAKKVGTLMQRVVAGTVLGVSGAVVILMGGWLFTAVTSLVVYQATQEYFGFVTSKGISAGMAPPPPVVSSLTTLLCLGLTIWTHIFDGRPTAALAVSCIIVLSLQLFATEKPRFSQLASSVFGLFYCGYLPSFWVKLRLLAVPALSSARVHSWPVLLGGLTHWTIGLISTLMSVACIIAADTGAYFFGKAFGRTQLTAISPKKTVEGALGGLLCSVAVALGSRQAFAWPAVPLQAAIFGVIVFFASLFGDLIESVMKRDAGLKDASNLIPGHGGLLDRFDSYMFTGATVFFYIRFVLPMFGFAAW